MTQRKTREKVRAVFLAALMVVSVFGGTMALAGTAGAAATSSDLSETLVQGGDEVYLNGTVNANGTVYAFIDVDGDGNYSSGSDILNSVSIDNYNQDNEYSITLTAPSESGTYDVYVLQKDSGIQDGDEGDITPDSLQVDDDAPVAENPSPEDGEKISTTTPVITLDLNETETSINESTIEVSASNGGHQLFELTTAANGVSYADGTLTVDISESKLDQLPSGTISMSVSAEDMAGNALTGGDFSFDINVDPVTAKFDGGVPDGTITTDEPATNITASVGTTVGNMSSATLTVESDDGSYVHSVTNDTSGASELTFDASFNGTFPKLADGDYTVTLTGTDKAGNSDTVTDSFSVDTTAPTVESVMVSDGTDDGNNVVEFDESNDVEITVEFSEPVKSFGGTVNISDSEYTKFTQADDGDFTPGDETVTFTLDLSGVDADDGSAFVNVTSASDVHSNADPNLNTSASEGTFSIDTQAPSVTLDESELPQDGSGNVILSGVVDIEDAFSASDTEGREYNLWIMAGAEGDYVPLSEVTGEPLNDLDTTTLPEGKHMLKISVTDDAGNYVFEEQTIYVDNAEPSLSYDEDAVLTGEVDVSEFITVENADSGTDAGYKVVYSADDDFTSTTETVTLNDGTFNVNEQGDGYYKITVTASDAGYEGLTNEDTLSVVVPGEKFSVDEFDLSSSDDSLTLNVTTSTELTGLNVTLETVDNYYQQSSWSLTADDFEAVESADNKYTVTIDGVRDGQYKATFENGSSGAQYVDTTQTDSASVDDSAPKAIDADIVGMDGGDTVVRVRFSEPIDYVSDVSFADGRSSVIGVGGDASTGVVRMTFEGQLQTGDENAKLTFSEGSLFDFDSSSESDKHSIYVSSAELDLHEGLNYVSAPIKTGSISLSELAAEGKLDHVDAIWAYDNGEWVSFDPDAESNELTALEGGMGYVVVADSSTSFDIRGYTTVAESAGDGPTAPQVQELEPGWNLIGHYQTGEQAADVAVGQLAYDSQVGILGENGMAVSLQYVDHFQPGEGYWIFVRESGLYTPVKESGGVSAPSIDSLTVTDGGDDIVTNGDSVTVTAEVSSEAGIETVWADVSEVNTSQSWLVPLAPQGDGTYSTPVDVVGVSDDATLTVDVYAQDVNGQVTEASDSSLTTDTKVNTVSIDSISDTSVDFTVNDHYGIDSATLRVTASDGTEMGSTTVNSNGSYTLSNFDLSTTDDNYTVTLTATNTRGVTNTTSENYVVSTTGDLTSSSLSSASATPNPTTYSLDSSKSTAFSFTVSDLSADGNTDTFYVTVPDTLANNNGGLSTSGVSTTNGLVSSSAEIVDGPDNDGIDDTIKFATDQVGGGTYSVDVSLDASIDYESDGDYPVSLGVQDSDTDSFSTTLTTLTADNTAPTLDSASFGSVANHNTSDAANETTVTLTLNDSLSGLDVSTIDASDFQVNNTTSSTTLNIESIDKSSISDGDTSGTVTITVSGEHSAGELEIELASSGSISDVAGAQLTNGNEGTVTAN